MPAERLLTRHGLFGDGLWAALGYALSLGSALAVTLFLSRLLAPADLGRYFLLMSAATILATIAQFGLGPIAVRRLANPRAASADRRAALVDTLAASALSGLIVVMLGPLVGWLLALTGWSVALFALWALALAWQGLCGELLRGLGAIDAAALHSGAAGGLSFAAGLGLAALRGNTLDLTTVLVIVALSATLSACGAVYALWRHTRHLDATDARPQPLVSLAAAWPVLHTHLAWLLLGHVDLWLVALVCSPAEVALYGLAVRLTRLLTLPQEVAKAALAPRLAALAGAGQHATIERLVRSAAGLATAPALLAVLITIPAGTAILGALFGPPYQAAALPLVALAGGQTVALACGLAATSLTMAGYQHIVLQTSLVGGILAILPALLLAHTGNLNTIAIALAFGIALRNLFALGAARRLLGIWTHALPLPPRLPEDGQRTI